MPSSATHPRFQQQRYGRDTGASHVWLETSNVNVPGVLAYERLGYSLCGVDFLYYGPYMPGERALYLTKHWRELCTVRTTPQPLAA